VLVALAIIEDGLNWVKCRYRRADGVFAGPWNPGWELPESWTTPVAGDTGCPNVGVVEVLYAADTPDWPARDEMRKKKFLAGAPRPEECRLRMTKDGTILQR
jgi:hypothetical protein